MITLAEKERPAWPWLLAILALGLGSALALIHNPWFAAAQYEEANPGLIALEALKGNFYPIYWGDTYGGTLHAFVTAGFFKLFGLSMLVFRLSNWFWWAIFIVFLYLLGRDIFDRRTGLLAALFMALPPAAGAYFSIMGWTGYVATVPLGTALFWLIHRACLREPDCAFSWFWVFISGVLMGVIIWIHLVGVPYLAAAGLAALLARPGRFIKRDAWLLLAGLLLGAAPFIHFNLVHEFPHLDVGETARGVGIWGAVLVLFKVLIPQLLGAVPVYLQDTDWSAGPALWCSLALSLLLLACFCRYWLPSLLTWPPLAGKPEAGVWLLVVFMAASVGVWFLSPRAGDIRPRYLHILSTALPILTACAVWRVAGWLGRGAGTRGLVAAVLAGAVLCIHGLGLAAFWLDRRPPRDAGKQEQAVAAFLENLGIKHFYAHYRISMPVCFMSWGRLIGADYFGCQTAAYLPRVEAAEKVAVVTHSKLRIPHPDAMRSWLKDTLNARFKEKRIGSYTVFYDIAPPVEGLMLLPRKGWSADANVRPEAAMRCLDGDIATKWSRGEGQQPGDRLVIDLGRQQDVNGVLLLPGRQAYDGPLDLALDGSLDGVNWFRLAKPSCLYAKWMGPHPRWREAGPSQFVFPVKKLRYLRMETGKELNLSHPYNWTVAEVFLYGPGESDAARLAQQAGAILPALEKRNVAKVLTTDFWAAGLTAEADSRYRTQLAYAPANSRAGCSWHGWAQRLFDQALFTPGPDTVLALPAKDMERVAQLLAAKGFNPHPATGLNLSLAGMGRTKLAPLEASPLWQASGEGKTATGLFTAEGGRWTPGKAQAPGQELVVDFGGSLSVGGFILEHGAHTRDYPRGLSVWGSADGREWKRLPAAISSPRLWWSGEALLSDRTSGVRALWPVTRLKKLKIVQTASEPIMWWSATRLTLLGAKKPDLQN